MKFILFIYLFISVLQTQSSEFLSEQLLRPYGWVSINDSVNKGNDPLIYTKDIYGFPYQALMIKDIIPVESKKIISIIKNVENYDDIFVSSKLVSTSVISNDENLIDAYQHLPVPIPFISDRHYIFRMTIFENDSNSIRWILLDQKNKYISYLTNKKKLLSSAIYLNTGVGIWKVRKIKSNITEVSYRLYMDTGGKLPKFLVDWLNRTAANNVFSDIRNASLKQELIN